MKHRKNLPSLNNNSETQGSHQQRQQSKASRAGSNDSSVQMAIQIHGSQSKFTNASSGNGFLPGSRESSQVSGQSKSAYQHTAGTSNINLNQVTTNSQGFSSTKNSTHNEKRESSAKQTTKVDDTIL